MTDYISIIDKYYNDNLPLKEILMVHSRCVADKAVECAVRKNIDLDLTFVTEAAMLHDIGIFRCDASGIMCFGELPYICHGIEGSRLLREENLPRHALVCERHTGAGLSIEDIIKQKLPLPHRDMLPLSLEEKLICYADKFFSKSGNLKEEKSLEKVMASMSRHGEDSLKRFMHLHELFG